MAVFNAPLSLSALSVFRLLLNPLRWLMWNSARPNSAGLKAVSSPLARNVYGFSVSSALRSASSLGKKPCAISVAIIRALRLSKRSRLRRIARASRRVTAKDEPSLGLRPSENIRTPALITAHGVSSGFSRIIAQPRDVEPKSKASLYRIICITLKYCVALINRIYQNWAISATRR